MKRLLLYLVLIILLVGIFNCGGDTSGTVELAGYIRLENGSPVTGIDVIFFWPTHGTEGGGGPLPITTDSNGYYKYEYGNIFANDPVTITPQSDTYTFSPSQYDLASADDGYGNLDFLATEN